MGCCKASKCLNDSVELCFPRESSGEIDINSLKSEELEFKSWENRINFQNIYTKDITENLLSNFAKTYLSLLELNRLVVSLGFRQVDYQDFERFLTPSGYSLVKIYLSGILLGKGSNQEKLVCFFNLLDPDGRRYTRKTDLSDAISEMITISIGDDTDIKFSNEYIEKIRSAKSYTILNIKSKLCTDDFISMEMLNDLLTKNDLWCLFSSSGTRALMSNYLEANPLSINMPKFPTTEESTKIIKNQKLKSETDSATSNSLISDRLPSILQEEILSSSSDSQGPIELKIQISPTSEDVFSFYPNEDPIPKALEFAESYKLAEDIKIMFIKNIEELKNNL
jgi:hypothetical protein